MIEIHDLFAGYGKEVVLDGINLSLQKNEIHGIVGLNGSGKTTLFNTLFGTVQPISGQINYQGTPLSKHSIAFLETSNYFYPRITGKEYLQLFTLEKPDFDIDGWNELFGLPLKELISGYSTGMKKKLAFMGTIALDKPILLLDEPFNGIDLETHLVMHHVIETLRSENRIVLITSHILETLTTLCDKISQLHHGKIQQEWSKSEFSKIKDHLTGMEGKGYLQKIRELLVNP